MSEVQETIQAKAYELFKRYGIRSVTMDDIASHCGVSKKTLYLHFVDKDALVQNIMNEMICRSEGLCTTYRSGSENAVHELFQSMDMLTEMFDGVNTSMLYDLHKYHSAVFRKIEEHKQRFLYDITRNNLQRGIAEGLYRPELNVDIITYLNLHIITMIFQQDMWPKMKYSVLEIQIEAITHYLYGIATAKGVKLIEKYKQQRLKQD